MTFTPNHDFHSPELQSGYVCGLRYTARDPNEPGISAAEKAGRETLARLLPAWLAEGRVREGAPDEFVGVPSAKVGGVGTVS